MCVGFVLPQLLFMIFTSLVMLFFGVFMIMFSIRKNECHSKWWPRITGIILIMYSGTVLLPIITPFNLKDN